MKLAQSIDDVINAFERLPGIGSKTAARLAYYLLHVPQHELDHFAGAVSDLKRNTTVCAHCFNVGEQDPCLICDSPQRNQQHVVVVEQPLDVLAFERAGFYDGVYHVLHGAISPMNNIGPDELRLKELLQRVRDKEVSEIILAMNNNLEGEATAMYIAGQLSTLGEQLGREITVTRLAKGLPVGGEVEYADAVTLKRALEGRVGI